MKQPVQTSLLHPLTLVAFGGNALLQPEDLGRVEEQKERAEHAARSLCELVTAERDLVVVHGNGPQVGQVLIQMEEAATKVPPGTLDVAVAQTEGSIGFLLEVALRNQLRANALEREVATVLSLVVVDREDPAFSSPSKPIGPFFSRYRAHVLEREQGWQMVEDSGRGWRKVVPSPKPLEIEGLGAVRQLLAKGVVVIAGGGGGIPVIRDRKGALAGVEAVIDKDRTASLFARELKAELLVTLTGVPHVYKNFGKRTQEPLPTLSLRAARRMLEHGQFPPGSMGPKIEAALAFVEASGHPAVITDIDHLSAAVAGDAGTVIRPEPPLRHSQAPGGARGRKTTV
ncbi:MAG TPA: carbamate kinase [Thermoanaerobaculia bacterium]|nr:carbamate kinase [Thermoanaerobaculia bacterium]